ncbi:hypothetical protein Tco_1390242, partial [Tanacetum coccineum]
CETCDGPHHYYECQATGGFTQGDVYAATGNYTMGGGGTRPRADNGPVHISSLESTARVPSLVVQPTPAFKPNEIPERNPHQPPIPYPSRLNKDKVQDKSDIQIHKFLQMFKKLHFNISFVETSSDSLSFDSSAGFDPSLIFCLFKIYSLSSSSALLFELPATTLGTVSSLSIRAKVFTLFTVNSNRTLISLKEYPLNCYSV